MPTPNTREVAVAGRPPIKTTKAIMPFLANRLARMLPMIVTLNAVHKSQADAASALDIEVGTLRSWCKTLGIEWNNLKVYKVKTK